MLLHYPLCCIPTINKIKIALSDKPYVELINSKNNLMYKLFNDSIGLFIDRLLLSFNAQKYILEVLFF